MTLALIAALLVAAAAPASDPAALHAMAREYYAWRDREDPVSSSNQGLHTWDDQLSDEAMPKVLERRKHVEALLARVKALPTVGWMEQG